MDYSDHYEPPRNGWRTFIILWATQSLSQFGTQVTFFAMTIWLVQVLYARPEQRAELALALAAEGIAFGVTGLIAAPFAGAWADRHSRRRTMVAMDLASGGVTLMLVGLLVTGALQLWMWIVIAACLSAFGAFHTSAFGASHAMLLPPRQLARANGMVHTALAFTGIFSPVVAAAIIGLPAVVWEGPGVGGPWTWIAWLPDGTSLAVAMDAATYVAAAGAAALLALPSPRRTDLVDESGKMKRSIWADMNEGALYIWRRPPLIWLLSLFTVANLFLFPAVLVPLLVKFDLAADWQARGLSYEGALALLNTTLGIAGVVWGTAVTAWGGLKRRRVYAVLVPLLIAGLAQIGLGLSRSLYLSAAMVVVLIGMGTIMGSHMQAIWQTQTPRELQGRVFSVRRVIVQVGGPLGTALAGWAGGIFDAGLLIAAFGGLIAVYCTAQLFNRQLLQVEDREYLESMAAQAEVRASSGG